jgi:hypothetical protein
VREVGSEGHSRARAREGERVRMRAWGVVRGKGEALVGLVLGIVGIDVVG